MAWNEQNKGRNPWNGGNQGPPDLDEYARKLQRRLAGLWRGVGGRAGGGSSVGAGLIVVVAVLLWGLSGVYMVDAAERAVVLRFGEYTGTTLPGLRWHIPWPIERVQKVNVASIEKFSHETRILTADENLVEVKLAVQYRRKDPRAYLFNTREPVETLSEVSEAAIREAVGNTNMDFVLVEGRAEIAQRTKVLLQATLDNYGTGLEVTSVNLQDANFPQQVQAAVQDAIKAREDKDRQSLEAQAYANDVVPRATGTGSRLKEESEAYKARIVAQAQGDAQRFSSVLSEYQKAPQVTRDRMYLDAMQQIYSSTSKILVDSKQNSNLLYLPLDKLMQQTAANAAGTPSDAASPNVAGTAAPQSSVIPVAPSAGDARARDGRSRDRDVR